MVLYCYLIEPRHEKTGFFCICKNKDADQLRGNREADQRLCLRYMDNTIPLLPRSEISSLWPSSMHVELWSGKLARELIQNFRQINLIRLRGCFPVAHCDIIAKPSDLPEFFVSITTNIH